ncbi:hypothetical protein HUU53_05085 [Candidatus Micrarchaeota archaeon]|nr:hypothetical protein [Candidatus Micrarchaeota archaeon]
MLFELFSILASFLATALFLHKPRSLIVLFALAVLLFILLGPLSVIGFLAGGIVRIWLK